MKTAPRPIKLPTEEQIRTRLSHLATEANSLRRLLRIVRRKNRSVGVTGGEVEAANATR